VDPTLMACYRQRGVRINNPHVFIVEDGKAGGSLPIETVQTKHALIRMRC
jgi:hypothetical protein